MGATNVSSVQRQLDYFLWPSTWPVRLWGRECTSRENGLLRVRGPT